MSFLLNCYGNHRDLQRGFGRTRQMGIGEGFLGEIYWAQAMLFYREGICFFNSKKKNPGRFL
mgnify:CR=1 FL=1